MSAGSGVMHSEYNASDSEPVNFLQIWIIPNIVGVEPGYEQKQFHDRLKGQLCLVASPDGRDDSVTIHQNTLLYASRLEAGEEVEYELNTDRIAYLHVAKGKLSMNNISMVHGDGASIENEPRLVIRSEEDTELLLFDLPVTNRATLDESFSSR